jgi:hypothetical protein
MNRNGDEQAGLMGEPTAVYVQPEFEVDTPLVVYEPGFATANFFVGTDANLDPAQPAWMQLEYERDTPLVVYGPRPPAFWVGTSGDLEADK